MNNKGFDAQKIEKKWQDWWRENQTYRTENQVAGKENFYALSEFAYPSGNLHVGHWYAFAVPDIYARFKRMQGYNVLYPMGFDAFGLPAENAAIKRDLDPNKWTYENMDYMKKQLTSMGASFDWSRTLATCDPSYYRWTQWMFARFFENGLVYRDVTKVNWCEHDKTILANEQVVAGACERCGNQVIQKDMPQWMMKITDFADALVDDLEKLPWDDSIKQAQREWVGRKEGSLIPFTIRETETYDVNTGPGDDAFREGQPIVERDNVVVIIEHPDKDEFLCAKWKQVDWQGFVTGGIEEGKGPEETALEEVREETGYQNPEIVQAYDRSSHGLFWHVVKEQNRKANYRIVHVKLKDLEREESSAEEQAIAEFVWVPRAEVNDFLKREDMRYPWRVVSGEDTLDQVQVFTTRADTLFGATYLVLAPEHTLVTSLKNRIANSDELDAYLTEVSKKSDLDRQQSKEKNGVELKGVEAVNPATGQPIPIWIGDYVLPNVGTGAVMAVPAHDERDCEFALKYDLPFRFVVLPSAGPVGNSRQLITTGENAFILSAGATEEKGQSQINAEWNAMYDLLGECADGYLPKGKRFSCTFEGKLINSPDFNTQTSEDARRNITDVVSGALTTTYRIRDWGISRQRYWGCPIPVVYDPEGTPHLVPDEHLPWLLPEDVDHTPDGTAPLARSEELKKRTEEIFGKGWTPEVDTMDTFVDSSWYFYRYLDNQNEDVFASKEAIDAWMPVSMYFGGAEHTTMHLLYSRFWVKALYRLGLVSHDEPYQGRLNRGLILGPDGNKMSKSKGNVIDPDEVVSHVGADTVRMYLAFIGPFNEPGSYPWDPNGVVGIRRFLERFWRLSEHIVDTESDQVTSALHKTILKVTDDIDRLKLNTAISTLMIFVNDAEKAGGISKNSYEILARLIAPFAPHLVEEWWQTAGGYDTSVHLADWPVADTSLIMNESTTIGIQINGKVRAEIIVSDDEDEDTLRDRVMALPEVVKWTEGKEVKKFIYIPGKAISLVIV